MQDIYSYIKAEESKYQSDEIQIGENWMWNMRNHVQMIFHLKNSIFFTGQNDYLRAFKNIMQPMLNLSYWTEDLEVKDVVLYTQEENNRVLSFLLKKYHDEVYSKEHDLETMLDDISESDIDYGGALVQKAKESPEVLQLNSIAFCDQTNIEGSPIGFKMYFSPSSLRSMASYGWGKESNGADITLEELCTLAESEKEPIGTMNTKSNSVPGKQIEIYIVRGDMPEDWLNDGDPENYIGQLQIRAFYEKKDGKYSGKEGCCLYKKKDDGENLKFHTSKKIYGRALGQGTGELMIHPQIWTNCVSIWKNQALESGSKNVLYTDDPAYTTKNKIQDMENNEITTIEDGKRIERVPTMDFNKLAAFENEINDLYASAQLLGFAQDPILGKEAPSGTTFRGQERSVSQNKGFHDQRRGKRAKFIEGIYEDWIIPEMAKELTEDKKFMANLSLTELRWVADQVTTNAVNQKIIDLILEGKTITPEEQAMMTDIFKKDFLNKGNKWLIETVKKDFEGVKIKVQVVVDGKSKSLSDLSDKYLSILQVAMANPQFRQNIEANGMSSAFDDLLELGGLSQVDFATVAAQPVLSPMQPNQVQPQAQPQLNGGL